MMAKSKMIYRIKYNKFSSSVIKAASAKDEYKK